MSILSLLRAKDPDLVNLRKSLRAALVAVPLFAVLKVGFDAGPLAAYAFFACFVGLVYANFGGPRRSRALAYGAMIVICDGLIIMGALLSDMPVAATVAMFVIIFTVSFAAIFGGYAPSFMAPVALSYSLSVLDPVAAASIELRLIGWTLGGLAALVAALALWPVDRRPILRRTLARACAGIATALSAGDDRDAAETGYRQAADAVADVRRQSATPLRPDGPLARDIGLMHTIEHVEQAVDMTRRVLDGHGALHVRSPLTAACARSFRQSSAVLREETDPQTISRDLPLLENALLTEVRADDATIADDGPGHAGERADDAFSSIRRSIPILALSRIAMWLEVAAAAALGAGQAAAPSGATRETGPVSDTPLETGRRFRRILAWGFDLNSVILRNALRAAAAMSLAVILAHLVPVEHAFWITLATLLVLHSSAASTSATALQAVAGTLAGFVMAAVILLAFQNNPTALWLLLPIGIFLSAYTPNVVGFLTGQIAFNGTVVVLFTLIDPAGITTAVLRIETVALGAASGAVMAFIFWPHGARLVLAGAVARVYRTSAEGVRSLASASEDRRRNARSDMHGTRRQAEEAFTVALTERGRRIDIPSWLMLFRAPNMVHSLMSGLWHPPSARLSEMCGDAVAATLDHRDRVAAALDAVADRLDPTGSKADGPGMRARAEGPKGALAACLDRARPLGPEMIDNARRLIALNELLSYIDDDVTAAAPALTHTVKASRPRAWLRWSLAPTD